jgi:hypothetical protein
MSFIELEQQIKQLRQDFDEESNETFNEWLKEYAQCEAIEVLLANQKVADLVDRLRGEVETCKFILSTKRDASGPDEAHRLRNYLFDKIDLYNAFLEAFNTKSKKEAIENNINQYAKS